MKHFSLAVLCLIVAGCQPQNKPIQGYVEGEFLLIAPTTGGVLQSLDVKRGQEVPLGQPLFSLDLTALQAARDAAAAEIVRATAELSDLGKGERPEETEVILKQKEQADAALENARKDYDRIKPLVKTGAASKSAFDKAEADYEAAQARVQELDARLRSSALGAREDQIAAAKASVEVAKHNLIQAEKRLAQAAPKAPAAGRVENTYFDPSEYVDAGVPVVSLLPPDNVKVRFFVPQSRVPAFAIGTPVQILCDGCRAPIPGKVIFVAAQAEFTPPVIYSVESREKLVFMVEARADAVDVQLRPGLPVTIRPAVKK